MDRGQRYIVVADRTQALRISRSRAADVRDINKESLIRFGRSVAVDCYSKWISAAARRNCLASKSLADIVAAGVRGIRGAISGSNIKSHASRSGR